MEALERLKKIQEIWERYKLSNDKFFIEILDTDFNMYLDFRKEYHLDKVGGLRLLRIVLDRILGLEESQDKEINDKFIINYINEFNEYEKGKI